MPVTSYPDWLANLENEDLRFIRVFLLASGSLKEVAQHYKVSYPTVRLRLDRLLAKIRLYDDEAFDPFENLILTLALDGKLEREASKQLIHAYRQQKQGTQSNEEG